jgi:hypothetical protein
MMYQRRHDDMYMENLHLDVQFPIAFSSAQGTRSNM